jgi:hypothetical protein
VIKGIEKEKSFKNKLEPWNPRILGPFSLEDSLDEDTRD